MGQTFSDLVFGRRASPTPDTATEPATDTLTPAPVPESDVASSTMAPGSELARASSTMITASEPEEVTPTQLFAQGPSTEPTFLQRTNEFMRILFAEYDYVGESFFDASYSEDRRMRNLILEELPYVNITKVCVVKNSYLLGMYQLKKAEYQSRYGRVRELQKIHATDANNVDSIIRDNLDWRRVNRYKYGVGVSFSGDPDYCNFHCTPRNGSRRVFIVADVLVGRQTYGGQGLEIPPEDYDTAVGNNDLVYVKFYNNEFLPKYLVFYDAPPRNLSKYWINYPRRW